MLARGAAASFAVSVAGTGLGFLVQFLLARLLGPVQFGIYVYVLGWMNIALIIAKLDFDTAAVRFVGAYNANGAWSDFAGFLRRSLQIVGMLSLTVSIVGAAALWVAGDRLSTDIRVAAFAACLLLPFTAIQQLRANALQGLKLLVQAQAPVVVVRPFVFALGIFTAVSLLGADVNATGAILLNLGATLVALVVTSRLLGRAVPRETRAAAPTFHTRHWIHVAGAMFMISVANIVLSMQTDVVIVGSLLGTTAAGHYSVASQMSWIAIFGVMAVLSMASPMFAELHAQDRRADLQRLVQLASRMTTVVALPAVLVMIIGGPFILSLFGPSFADAYPVLVVLCMAQLVGALWGGVAGFMMTMTGHQKQAAIIVGVGAVFYIALAFILTPAFGAVGTATATVISYTGRSVAMWLYIRRTTGINVLPFGPAAARAGADAL